MIAHGEVAEWITTAKSGVAPINQRRERLTAIAKRELTLERELQRIVAQPLGVYRGDERARVVVGAVAVVEVGHAVGGVLQDAGVVVQELYLAQVDRGKPRVTGAGRLRGSLVHIHGGDCTARRGRAQQRHAFRASASTGRGN